MFLANLSDLGLFSLLTLRNIEALTSLTCLTEGLLMFMDLSFLVSVVFMSFMITLNIFDNLSNNETKTFSQRL